MYSLILTILHKTSGRSTVTVVDGFGSADDATNAVAKGHLHSGHIRSQSDICHDLHPTDKQRSDGNDNLRPSSCTWSYKKTVLVPALSPHLRHEY